MWLTPLHRAAASRNEVSNKLVSFCNYSLSLSKMTSSYNSCIHSLTPITALNYCVDSRKCSKPPGLIYALSSSIASFTPEGSGAAAEARCGGECTRQVLANAAACGCCQPCHTLRRGTAHPSEQPEHGRSHRQNCPAPCCSEWVSGGEASDINMPILRFAKLMRA